MKNYWVSEEWWSAWALLGANIALTLGAVYINVLLNTANGTFYTALQKLDQAGFYRAFVTILLLIVLYLGVVLPRSYLNQTLQLRWRRWLTDRYLTHWLTDRIFYRLCFSGKTDNPDQRISEDVRIFTELTVSLAFGLLSSLVTLASFAAILWNLSGSITVPIDGFKITIPGTCSGWPSSTRAAGRCSPIWSGARLSDSATGSRVSRPTSASVWCACARRPKVSPSFRCWSPHRATSRARSSSAF